MKKTFFKIKQVSSCFTFLLAFMMVSLSACTQHTILNMDDSLEDGKEIIAEKEISFDEFEKTLMENRTVLSEPENPINIAALSLLTSLYFSEY
ncbi:MULTISPECIES: hypothetical protein [Bacteroides]|uniref:hypothetical protein n=1 Tax=Bacteroides TaxID=816 RepID=UPI0005AA1FD2|nr:hypothetical protein [Bacteroides neonati]